MVHPLKHTVIHLSLKKVCSGFDKKNDEGATCIHLAIQLMSSEIYPHVIINMHKIWAGALVNTASTFPAFCHQTKQCRSQIHPKQIDLNNHKYSFLTLHK